MKRSEVWKEFGGSFELEIDFPRWPSRTTHSEVALPGDIGFISKCGST